MNWSVLSNGDNRPVPGSHGWIHYILIDSIDLPMPPLLRTIFSAEELFRMLLHKLL